MVKLTNWLRFSSIVIVLALLVAACGSNQHQAATGQFPAELKLADMKPVSLRNGEKLRVVATTSIVGDIVHQVGGDKIDLTVLLPIGADPHTFEPTPGDLARVADAHVIFANGLGLEQFLDEMLANAGGHAVLVPVSAGIEPRKFEATAAPEGENTAAPAGAVDPHTWTSPANAIVFVHNIEQTLSALDPANAATYQAGAAAYQTKLEELDQWVKAQIDSIPPENRVLVTDHTVFGYFADRYGLKQIGAVIPSFSTAAEPSAKELANLEQVIKQYRVKAIFVGNSVNPALSERVAQDTGVKLLTIYTGSLGPPGSNADNYIDYIKYDTSTIVNGLKG